MLNQTLVRSPTLRVLAIATGLYAIYLPLAVWLHRAVAAPRGAMVIRLTPVQLLGSAASLTKPLAGIQAVRRVQWSESRPLTYS
jgi:hypothetical protein